jgi:3-deoxy-D-manno-octulosonic-acid transferase
MKFLYNLGILIYITMVRLVSPFNRKARLIVLGWKNWHSLLSQKAGSDDKYIWVHCASLGEFEQGRPVIEELRKMLPQNKILLTFFSSSGYEVRKNYRHADIICYLPPDTPVNAKKFTSLFNLEKVIFVKYEFWNNYISSISDKNIPLYLISGIFRKDQYFFKWYGGFFRGILKKFTRIYVQDEESEKLLFSAGIRNVTFAGDTRFDRVRQIAADAKKISVIEQFRGNERMFLAGSSWKPDEEIIAKYVNANPGKLKWVFAPHEIDEENLRRLVKLFTVTCVRFSEFTENKADARVMIIDNIGMLSSAYRYAYIAEVGGGFGKGIHNVLEPACWGIPVLFGPEHLKFREAVGLIETGGGVSFKDYSEFEAILDRWLSDEKLYRKSAESAGAFVNKNSGATAKIISEIV